MRRGLAAVGFVLFSATSAALAQSPDDGTQEVDEALLEAEAIEEISLEELLTTETTVASSVGTTLRETPGIVTVVTREEIMRSGARDLIDVLRMVPAFFFISDVQGVVDIGFRGWGGEGKVLLLLDGQEMNETFFLALPFGNHYPVDQIERIEIIRGPGSAMYGGYAELAVIKITTRGAHELDGLSAQATYGVLDSTYARRNLSLQYGQEVDGVDGLSFSVAGFIGQGHRSGETYRDFYGNEFPMSENELNPMMLNVGAAYKDLKVRFIVDNYRMTTRDAYDLALPRAVDMSFVTYLAGVEHTLRISDDLSLDTSFRFKHQKPWRVTTRELPGVDLELIGSLVYENTTERYVGETALKYEITEGMNALVGVEVQEDVGHFVEDEDDGTTSTDDVDYFNIAAFTELAWQNPVVNLTLGARYENHSAFGSSFVPRVGLTRIIDPFHFKALFSLSFRAPFFEALRYNPDIDAERTTAFELEAGYRIDDHNIVTVNAYDLTVTDPITYFFDEETQEEQYINEDKVGIRGVDVEYRLRYSWGYAALHYSIFLTGSFFVDPNDIPDTYVVPGRDDELLGAPQHKVALNSAFYIDNFSISPTFVVTSGSWGFLTVDDEENTVLGKTDTMALFNLFVEYRFPWVEGLRAGVGVFDIFDSRELFVPPFDGYRPPLPGPSREFIARIGYDQQF